MPYAVPHSGKAPHFPAAARETVGLAAVERRQCAVAFCDLVDSTALASEVDPGDLNDILVVFHAVIAGAMAEFDGHVSRLVGDET